MNIKNSNTINCPICDSKKCAVILSGEIRDGAFPNKKFGNIFECSDCKVQFLLENQKTKINYETTEYRESLNQQATLDSYRKGHDHLQQDLIALIGSENIRDKSILDIGCGGGSFLDNIKGIAKEITCIEPCSEFQKSLRDRGYEVHSDIKFSRNSTYDLITSFHVIEHINDPLSFLKDIEKKMHSKSRLIITTPNLDDILNKSLKEYKEFFYRSAHSFYFNELSLKSIGERAGLICKKVTFKHRYSASNFFYWLKEKKPCGQKSFFGVNNLLNKFWASYLEECGLSEMIAIEFIKKDFKK